MSIQVFGDNKEIESRLVTFSDGAINLYINPEQLAEVERYLCFTIKTDTPVVQYDRIIDLAGNILSKEVEMNVECELHLPYFPNARADRVFEQGMSCPLSWTLSTINTSGRFSKVSTKDIHNKNAVESGLYSVDLEESTQKECLWVTKNREKGLQRILRSNDLLLCAPDKGARDKTKDIAESTPVAHIELEKVRDVKTGWIKSVDIVGKVDVDGLDILIVDDICDGGMTFIKSAEALRNAGARSVSLYVTHGIFSKGLDIFNGLIDNIFCNQIIMNYVTQENINEFNGGK